MCEWNMNIMNFFFHGTQIKTSIRVHTKLQWISQFSSSPSCHNSRLWRKKKQEKEKLFICAYFSKLLADFFIFFVFFLSIFLLHFYLEKEFRPTKLLIYEPWHVYCIHDIIYTARATKVTTTTMTMNITTKRFFLFFF